MIDGEVKVYICPVEPNKGIGSEIEFDSLTNKIYFDYEKGIEFFKYRMGENAPDINDRIGYNSPDSLLAHELIHAYNSNYDIENYIKRKKEVYSSSSSSYENSIKYQGFPNEEERYVTLELTNQVNEVLGETKRMNYSQKSVQKK